MSNKAVQTLQVSTALQRKRTTPDSSVKAVEDISSLPTEQTAPRTGQRKLGGPSEIRAPLPPTPASPGCRAPTTRPRSPKRPQPRGFPPSPGRTSHPAPPLSPHLTELKSDKAFRLLPTPYQHTSPAPHPNPVPHTAHTACQSPSLQPSGVPLRGRPDPRGCGCAGRGVRINAGAWSHLPLPASCGRSAMATERRWWC